MLRRKLLARLGLLVIGFVTGAAVAIAMLQDVLHDLDTVNADAEVMFDRVQSTVSAVADLESLLTAGPEGGEALAPTVVAEKTGAVTERVEQLRGTSLRGKTDAEFAASISHAGTLAGTLGTDRPDPAALAALRGELTSLGTEARRYVAREQALLSWHLRALIIGLTVAALVMTNIAIYVLVRTANMILRPVGQLIEGSRELARERFEHRIHMTNTGEFAELASAYNSLAEQLQSNEQKKVKALQQLAVTLNHELNNVINAIELQLRIVNRRTGGDPQLASHLAEIHNNLERMAKTVASLRSVRRVVLTDYMPGEPMVDLPRSTAADDPPVVVRQNSPTFRPAPSPAPKANPAP